MPVGKPAISNLRSAELRDLQAAIANIRERIEALDALVTSLSSTVTATTSGAGSAGVNTSAAALVRSFNSMTNGLVAKIAASTFASRSLQVPVEFDIDNADGVGGSPSFDWAEQPANLVLASPQGYPGRPEFRALELASEDFEGQGGLGQVLHGNEYGAPTWGPVDLATDVDGVLGFDNLAGTYDIDILGAAAKLSPVAPPSSSTDDGEEGQVAWDASYLYLCMGPYTWRRVALATF